jgi:hypothetical protein
MARVGPGRFCMPPLINDSKVGGLKISISEHRGMWLFSWFQQRPNSLDKLQPGWISIRDLPAGVRLVATGYFDTMED